MDTQVEKRNRNETRAKFWLPVVIGMKPNRVKTRSD